MLNSSTTRKLRHLSRGRTERRECMPPSIHFRRTSSTSRGRVLPRGTRCSAFGLKGDVQHAHHRQVSRPLRGRDRAVGNPRRLDESHAQSTHLRRSLKECVSRERLERNTVALLQEWARHREVHPASARKSASGVPRQDLCARDQICQRVEDPGQEDARSEASPDQHRRTVSRTGSSG